MPDAEFSKQRTFLNILPQIQVTLDCNSNCTYCFQKHENGIIDIRIVENILEKIVSLKHKQRFFSYGNVIKVNWHGGEPLLAGVDFFRNVIDIESFFPDVIFENRVQTNGTIMTEEIAEFFAEHDFNVGFSLDGPEDIHNQNRYFHNSRTGTFAATMRGIELYRRCTKHEKIPVMAVVTPSSIGRHKEIFEFFKELNAQVYLNIYDIRCFELSDSSSIFEFAPSSEDLGEFLIRLFDLWFYDRTRRVDFKDLRNEVKMILQPELKLGNPFHKKRCDTGRTIFDPHGKVYACDQYINTEEFSLGDICRDSLENIMEKKLQLWENIKLYIRKSRDEMACCVCEWGSRCIGG